MSIISARRISQAFFLVLFLWFCVVTTAGEKWYQLRGWPVNWLLEMDPLVGLGTLLGTHELHKGLLWGLAVIILTILLGRFFCSWVCPFGTIHQIVGFLGRRKQALSQKIDSNRFNPWQSVKYWLLVFLLSGAAADFIGFSATISRDDPRRVWLVAGIACIATVLLLAFHRLKNQKSLMIPLTVAVFFTAFLNVIFKEDQLLQNSLQTGLLDPITLVYRSINLILLPMADAAFRHLSPTPRFYQGAWFIGALFFTSILLNLKIPRFYCRFICPLGALFGLLSRYAVWRIGKTDAKCAECLMCEKDCEGACSPSGRMILSECVLCLNCIKACHTKQIAYQKESSAGGELLVPDLSRRGFMISLFSGVAAIPISRTSGVLATNWNPGLIRPPGTLSEKDFLSRCIKCGQCMRICPTNVIQPAIFEGGIEGVWTPVLNFRIGRSGCRHTCIACGHLCPTGAIRPITLGERMGKGIFLGSDPVRIGTAFIDRGRCFPWSMDKPCIVCQENCPVSPKAIFTKILFSTLRIPAPLIISSADSTRVMLEGAHLVPNRLTTGDYFVV
jgi:polyferredoxin